MMKTNGIKIAISPEDRSSNAYNSSVLFGGRPTNEHDQMCRYADCLQEELERSGFTVLNMQYGNMYDRVRDANNANVNLYIAPHTNGFDGTVTGCRIHCYPSDKSRAFGQLLVDGVRAIYYAVSPAPKIVESTTLYELKGPKAPAVLPEWGFHDNRQDAEWIVDNVADLAIMTAKACCQYFKVPYVSRETSPNKMFCVQVGAFSDRKNAENMLKMVKNDYPDAFIKEVRT